MDATALALIAALLIAYAAVSYRLQSTVVTQAMVFVTVGLLGAWVLRTFAGRGWMDRTWQQVNGAATALAYTVASALGGSGFIAAFVAGVTFGVAASDRADATTMLAEQNGELLNAVTFLMFGAVLLGPALTDLDWRIVLYAILSLTVARMLPVAVAMLGRGMRRVTVAFIGWFGSRELASIVFVLIIVEQSELTHRPLIMTVVACTVAVVRLRPRIQCVARLLALRRLVCGPRNRPRGHARECSGSGPPHPGKHVSAATTRTD